MSASLNHVATRVAAAVDEALGEPVPSLFLRRSPNPKFGDFQTEVALALAKRLGKKPRDLAASIVERLRLDDVAESVEVSGPGFVCIRFRAEFLAEAVRACRAPRAGITPAKAQTIVIDYSSPNVAKEMHVGHLRTTIIGDCLARVFEYLGHKVIRQNHIGDWGTPFGMLIEHLRDLGRQQASEALSVGDLDGFYRQARAKFDNEPGFADRSRERVVLLQKGDAETLELWKVLVDESTRYFSAVYAQLGIKLSDADICGESFYNPMLADVAEDLEKRNIAVIDDGALCVFPEGFLGRDGEPTPLMVRKRDGGFGYAATDLAAIRYRVSKLGANRIVYVVGAPQAQHFAMVFAVARMAGYLPDDVIAEHVGFGSVLGSDKKMLKSRSGDAVKLSELLSEAVARAGQVVADKNPDLEQSVRDQIAREVGIGAIKYADMSSDRVKDYVFDWDRMMSLEGNTAPYVQYAHARIHSILRKANLPGGPAQDSAVLVQADAERDLALRLLEFEGTLSTLVDGLKPHVLCTYLYGLANDFATFYNQCSVLKAETDELRQSRLAMCDAVARVLSTGLDLLGIAAPARM